MGFHRRPVTNVNVEFSIYIVIHFTNDLYLISSDFEEIICSTGAAIAQVIHMNKEIIRPLRFQGIHSMFKIRIPICIYGHQVLAITIIDYHPHILLKWQKI